MGNFFTTSRPNGVSVEGSRISVGACAPMAYGIECGKFSYTDFTSLSNAPEAHTLNCSRGAQALLVRCKRITQLKPGFNLRFFLIMEDSCIFRQ
jgi:hypothetical protein